MKMRLKKLILDNFKGVTHKEYDLDSPLVRIFGMNAKGKTTIATAYFWLFQDKDYELKSNPAIRPIGVEECIPTVTAIVDIDGKEYTFAKMQKQRVSKPDESGVSKISLTNTYEVNSVPKAERDFKAYLEEKGIQLDNFLVCSHPDVFTGQKQADMRKVLFKMASRKTDYDIASFMDEAKKKYASLSDADADLTTVDDLAEKISPTWEVALLLKTYTLQEIEAMNKASKKKADEQVEAIPNQIVGLESAKADIDVAELELAKNALNEQIAALDTKINDSSKIADELGQKEIKLMFDVNAYIEKANKGLNADRLKLSGEISDLKNKIDTLNSDTRSKESFICDANGSIEEFKRRRETVREEYTKVNGLQFDEKPFLFDESKWSFDENSTVCSLCGQALPDSDIEKLKLEFEQKKESAKKTADEKLAAERKKFAEEKAAEIKRINESGTSLQERIKGFEVDIENTESDLVTVAVQIAEKESQLAALDEKYNDMPETVDLTADAEYQKIAAELTSVRAEIENLKSSEDVTAGLKEEKAKLQGELNSVFEQLGKASNNIMIDEQIAELRQKQRDYEQKKADAEKILHQLSLVSKRKNSLLVDEINHHFSIVKWKLFDYAKNGEYKEVCVPYVTVNGKELEFNDSMNTGLKIRAKLDICNSFQKFFGVQYPVFLDNCESINTVNLPKMDTQLITLSVSDDKELRIEVTE